MNSTAPVFRIRPATPQDSDALFEICLKTADSGNDATALYSDPRLPGYIWAAAYGALEPDLAFVLDDGEGAVGYVIGARDTAAFYDRLDAEWWPEVRQAIAGFTPKTPFDTAAVQRITTPEQHPAWLQADYPAHLHINLLPPAQSGGWGRRMIETELDALRRAGVQGVHLGVSPANERAKGFYEHVGFTDLSRDGKVLYGMKLGV
ncbi:MAG TPA: GNAT family N-acetyltransferase [Devosia sp.]|jgi:ribosomal protein S18 acetylase RimI-like enzyme|nr:GNAT family N-acetyltransferase [Devosia sp.]